MKQHTPVETIILDKLNIGILVLNQGLDIEYMNPAAENLLEMSIQQTHGYSFPLMTHLDAPVKQRLLTAAQELVPYTERALEIFVLSGRKTVDITVNPTSHSEMIIEITQIDYQLRISREENLLLQQQAGRELLRGLAHEIKNPLGGLRGAAQLLDQELPNVELREYTRVIIGEADRLRDLVDRMLGPRNIPKKATSNIHQILERVIQLVTVEYQALDVSREYDPSIPDLLADADLLVQAMLNIMRNAAQMGASQLTIMTSLNRNFTIGHQLHKLVIKISIIDNGPGVPADMLEKIFYPMVTGRADGTGLGLSIAQSLLNEHHGLIECESEAGKTEFIVLIPLEELHG
ncbi:MAG: nitrogen regulation protein NR(II) [Gammaproteobacteria bacterium]